MNSRDEQISIVGKSGRCIRRVGLPLLQDPDGLEHDMSPIAALPSFPFDSKYFRVENGKGKRVGNTIALFSCIGTAPLQDTDFIVIRSICQAAARHLNIDLVFAFTN